MLREPFLHPTSISLEPVLDDGDMLKPHTVVLGLSPSLQLLHQLNRHALEFQLLQATEALEGVLFYFHAAEVDHIVQPQRLELPEPTCTEAQLGPVVCLHEKEGHQSGHRDVIPFSRFPYKLSFRSRGGGVRLPSSKVSSLCLAITTRRTRRSILDMDAESNLLWMVLTPLMSKLFICVSLRRCRTVVSSPTTTAFIVCSPLSLSIPPGTTTPPLRTVYLEV
ncbi:hypothetical protein MUK42_35941 [Musa troglodytarum]|uniref:Uncharacterized protein n=1 Tax=Musa troglodytarum TaxID=320322 RepID=A0A9E7HZQ9_9LILI|nr:hypothetical protein MUK42_35941 [Musa troglodytarum]URE39234.1 hypothetical protein MUK42_35941 [Musa troglodytarum]